MKAPGVERTTHFPHPTGNCITDRFLARSRTSHGVVPSYTSCQYWDAPLPWSIINAKLFRKVSKGDSIKGLARIQVRLSYNRGSSHVILDPMGRLYLNNPNSEEATA
ncbi:hypothetical protein Salmi_Mp060 (mitochondrion) [Salvia miltiorrhiza]|uniref:Uncharacterized protein n=1 Tax=Salvia miltiorrhiza TaxID=226208 RepID=V9P579_SALMI|nr:hypothetical protein Salmi_Mp060 [Salvia miltiorrhiza]AGU16589.1 hypothetical protein Salmi_Mp060 [Salvia miltiorrhiza]